jgi:mono/diheme cytochrome c family protein
MSAARYIQGAAALGVAVLALAACDNLKTQPRDHGWRPADAQPDKRIWPPRPPANTVAREDAPQPPPQLTSALLQRGQQRFNIYCTPCHGYAGDAHGMVVQRGFPAPPSFHIDRLRAAPTQHFYDVISNGWGAMYSYADRVAPADRWAIAAYVRALQESQNMPLASLSDAERKELK